MEKVQGNLLVEPRIQLRDRKGVSHSLTLPGVLAWLSDPKKSTVAFTALQAHQSHAWHAFLVQLAAIVCHRTPCSITDARCQNEPWWKDRLLELAGCEEAWCLLVSDLSKPAFLQSPTDSLRGYEPRYTSPCELDILVTSKHHDVKKGIGGPDQWLFSLVTLQTMQGYLGRGNYGVFRMNGGTGNRFAVGLTTSFDLGAWFRRDVVALLTYRDDTVKAGGFARRGGITLLWLFPWDGKEGSAIPHNQLDPWCIEICRRLRFREEKGQWIAYQAPTEAERTSIAKKGGTWIVQNAYGDPWMACDRKGKAITPSERGFPAEVVVRYLFSNDTIEPPSQQWVNNFSSDSGELLWYGRTLVRGQGQTGGWHEQYVPVRGDAVQREKAKCAERAQAQLDDMASLQKKVLSPALTELEKAGGRNSREWLRRYEEETDGIFFPHLWDYWTQTPEEARGAWRRRIVEIAEEILEAAQAAVPEGIRRWSVLARSQQRFRKGLRTQPNRHSSFWDARVAKVKEEKCV